MMWAKQLEWEDMLWSVWSVPSGKLTIAIETTPLIVDLAIQHGDFL